MKCQVCGRELVEKDSFSFQGKVLCEDDYIKLLSSNTERECDPWVMYLSAQERGGSWPKTTDNLTDLQRDMYRFMSESGKITREALAAKYGLPEDEITLHLNVLMHSELVKEKSEGGVMYLRVVPLRR